MINNIAIILLPLLVGLAIHLSQRIVIKYEMRKLEKEIKQEQKELREVVSELEDMLTRKPKSKEEKDLEALFFPYGILHYEPAIEKAEKDNQEE